MSECHATCPCPHPPNLTNLYQATWISAKKKNEITLKYNIICIEDWPHFWVTTQEIALPWTHSIVWASYTTCHVAFKSSWEICIYELRSHNYNIRRAQVLLFGTRWQCSFSTKDSANIFNSTSTKLCTSSMKVLWI